MIIAIIPIKHNSERVPKKNYRDFNGKPLYYYIINTVLQSKYIDKIIIDTNSEIVIDGIRKYFDTDKIIIYQRPLHLCPGDTPVNKLLINVINELNLNADFYIQTHTTNPLLTIETIDKSIETFIEKKKIGYDSLFSVKSMQTRLYFNKNDNIIALNHNIDELIPTQNLEPIYDENSCIYIFTKDKLILRNHRIGNNPYIFIMDNIESQDIDTEYDFEVAQLLHKNIEDKKINSQKNVLITGINGGIGKEIAKIFKKHYWYIIGTDLQENCTHDYFDRYIKQDLLAENSCKKIIDNIFIIENKLNCIINNAALQITGDINDFNEDDWDNIYKCNVKCSFLLSKYGYNMLSKTKGNIINIASIHSICTSQKIAAYASSKSALVGLTRNLAIELGKYNIRVNSISPGATDTQMLRFGLNRDNKNIEENILIKQISNKHLLNKIGKPEEIAELTYQVCINEFINGANLIIDGGASIKLSTE